jgi:spoIIIJ-associated protein
MVEWVEVRGISVEVAVKAALEELGIEDEARAEVKVLQEPQRGFLGIGRQDAIVHVKPSRKRRRKGSRGGRKRRSSRQARPRPVEASKKKRSGVATAAKQKQARGRRSSKKPKGSGPSGGARKPTGGQVAEREGRTVAGDDLAARVLGDEQAAVVKDFLSGLLAEFGLEGRVETRFDGRILHADVLGEQTEALIGAKATVMQAVHELTKTVVQRKTARNCRLRLDIAGYGQRRRKALAIYAGRLASQALDEGGEIMLEPMNAADRKVVHDAVAAVDGVRSYSEGAEPRRSVVISQE